MTYNIMEEHNGATEKKQISLFSPRVAPGLFFYNQLSAITTTNTTHLSNQIRPKTTKKKYFSNKTHDHARQC